MVLYEFIISLSLESIIRIFSKTKPFVFSCFLFSSLKFFSLIFFLSFLKSPHYTLNGLPWWLRWYRNCCLQCRIQSLGQEDPLEEEMTTCSSILTWRVPWTEESGGLQFMQVAELDTAVQLTHCNTRHSRNVLLCKLSKNVISYFIQVNSSPLTFFLFFDKCLYKIYNTGVGSHFLLQGIFLIQGSKPGLMHYRKILYHLSDQGSPYIRCESLNT